MQTTSVYGTPKQRMGCLPHAALPAFVNMSCSAYMLASKAAGAPNWFHPGSLTSGAQYSNTDPAWLQEALRGAPRSGFRPSLLAGSTVGRT